VNRVYQLTAIRLYLLLYTLVYSLNRCGYALGVIWSVYELFYNRGVKGV